MRTIKRITRCTRLYRLLLGTFILAALFIPAQGQADGEKLYKTLKVLNEIYQEGEDAHYEYRNREMDLYLKGRRTALPIRQAAPITNVNIYQNQP